MKVIVQERDVQVSGYVRGYKTYKVYYNADTLEILDAESIGEVDVDRDDTSYEELPNFNDNLNYIREDLK